MIIIKRERLFTYSLDECQVLMSNINEHKFWPLWDLNPQQNGLHIIKPFGPPKLLKGQYKSHSFQY